MIPAAAKVPLFSFVHLPRNMPNPKNVKVNDLPEKKKKVYRIGEQEALAFGVAFELWQVENETNFPLVASFLATFAACPPRKKEIQALCFK